MDEFQKKFLEEATDLINDLEVALLRIEKNPSDKKLIEKIFRNMHSLKGGGAMFGFEKVSELTHNLENIYDLVRNDKSKINREILDVTLLAVDHLKKSLNAENSNTKELVEEHNFLLGEIEKILSAEKAMPEILENKDNPEAKNQEEKKTFHIYFVPNHDIFDNGTNPLYLIDEIHTIGDCSIFTHYNKIPQIDELQPTNCYCAWDILCATSQGVEAIKDVFMFVEEECLLEITELSRKNLLVDKQFLAWIEENQAPKEGFNIIEIRNFLEKERKKAENVQQTQTPKIKKSDNKEQLLSSIRVSSEKIDHLMNLVSELVTTQASLSLYAEKNKTNELVLIAENVENLTRQLRDIAFTISLVPVDTMMTRFQRLIRDLSTEFNKEIHFNIEGAETELDKTLIQSLTEPLMHIIRNSVDHGIESPQERIRKGKEAQGRIDFKSYYSGASVHIVIRDDGKGIDLEQIRKKAIDKGIITPETILTEKELINLIFLPGFSTAKLVTDVSGRGVGMDVVKRKIHEIRGEVEVDSVVDVGTTITIKLPLTLSIIDGLLVCLDQTRFVIPLNVVNKIHEIGLQQMKEAFNNIVVFEDKQIPFYYLRDEFEIYTEAPEQQQLVIVKYEDVSVGLAVDLVIGEYQAVLKPLGRHYRNHEIISGATILGDGTIALVLDTNKIIKQFSQQLKEE